MIKSFSIDEIQEAPSYVFVCCQKGRIPHLPAYQQQQQHQAMQLNGYFDQSASQEQPNKCISNLFATYIFKLYILNLKGLCNVHM